MKIKHPVFCGGMGGGGSCWCKLHLDGIIEDFGNPSVRFIHDTANNNRNAMKLAGSKGLERVGFQPSLQLGGDQRQPRQKVVVTIFQQVHVIEQLDRHNVVERLAAQAAASN